jgi:hypothetical protein
MDSREPAIARLRSLLKPSTQFGAGARIYESGDLKKQEIQSFAIKTADAFESGRAATHAELTIVENKLEEYRAHFDSHTDDPELQEYLELLSAIEALVVVCRHED